MKKKFLPTKYNYLLPFKTECLRIGLKQDGGYVIRKNELNSVEKIISLGMGSNYEDWSFELYFLKRKKNLQIFFYDYTVSKKNYLFGIFRVFRRFIKFRYKFEDLKKITINFIYYLRLLKSKNIFHIRKKICSNPKNSSEENIKNILKKIDNKNILLKVDIEGTEYEVIDDIFDNCDKVVSIIIEFHNIDKFESIFEKKIKKLKSKYEIIHVHGNNNDGTLDTNLPITLEVTMVNKKCFKYEDQKFNYNFPVKNLDYPNNLHKKDIEFCFKES